MSRSDETAGRTATGYDAELQRLDPAFRRASGIQPGDRVLDIGCGTGQTSRAAAARAHQGRVLGVDISASALERARELAQAEGLQNVSFEPADAQVHPFPEGAFDVAISRFGSMFFDDPVAAFSNIARALRPGGRLVSMVWQAGDRNEWDVVIRRSLARSPEPAVGAGAFSLADPARTAQVLRAAGFVDITFTEVDAPVWYGPDAAAAMTWIHSFTSTRELLERLDGDHAAQAVARLRQAVSAHLRDDGVWFGARAWIVAARRRSTGLPLAGASS